MCENLFTNDTETVCSIQKSFHKSVNVQYQDDPTNVFSAQKPFHKHHKYVSMYKTKIIL